MPSSDTDKIYSRLIVNDRVRPSTRGQESMLVETESDRSRVLYSSAFRRLQGKTQVFPLDDNAAVRTRLTHSLEVAHVGRYLASTVLKQFGRTGRKKVGLEEELAFAFPTIVETACLLHDIGNPPFGHFGETAISQWFSEYKKRSKEGGDGFAPEFCDLIYFDGNPQGFRIAVRLGGEDAKSGLNLTLTQLASMIKYVALPQDIKESGSTPLAVKKAGAFHSEEEVFKKIRERFELKIGQRFPLAYLMEAADDISYCLSDLEDGIEKGLVSFSEVADAILQECDSDPQARTEVENARKAADSSSAVNKLVIFRSRLIRALVEHAGVEYVRQHDAIVRGEIKELIDVDTSYGVILKAIKGFARSNIYDNQASQLLELTGLSVVSGLLDQFRPLMDLERSEITALMKGQGSRNLEVPKRLLGVVAEKHRNVYQQLLADSSVDDQGELSLRGHMMVDFISGMTDRFSLSLYQRLKGISL